MTNKGTKLLSNDETISVEGRASDGTLMTVNIALINDRLYVTADTGETIVLTPGTTRVYE